MNLTDNPLPLFAAITVGVIAQQVLTWLKQRESKTPYTIARSVVLIYWIGLGLVMIIGGAGQVSQGNFLPGVSGLALGLGLMLSGLGQALERGRLKTVGVVVLSAGPIIAGIGFILSGNPLSGMVALALGLGIVASVLKGWIGGVGQIVVGAVILGSSVMLLIGALTMNVVQAGFTTIAIGVIMFALGLWAIIGGGAAVIGSIRQSARAPQPSP